MSNCEIKIIVREQEALFRLSGGDARKLLNLFELVVDSMNEEEIELTDAMVTSIAQKKLPCMINPVSSIMI